MKLSIIIAMLLAALGAGAQTVANTANVLHPLTKNPANRNGISSLNNDPSVADEYKNPAASRMYNAAAAKPAPNTAAATAATPAHPTVIATKIDSHFAASEIKVIGSVSGLKGRMTVTNLGSAAATPEAHFAVLNDKGVMIGTETRNGAPLAPNASGEIDVVSPAAGAVDLKLVKLAPLGAH